MTVVQLRVPFGLEAGNVMVVLNGTKSDSEVKKEDIMCLQVCIIMCVCLCMYMCVYMHVCVCVSTCVCVIVQLNESVYLCKCLNIH